MSEANPYLHMAQRNLPRLLALYNTDATDPLFGCGDRRYWAWKLIDFPNGTFQGACYGLSILLDAGLLPDSICQRSIQRRIEAMISVLPQIVDKQGGLAEALPNEGSFCVTGLVLSDCLGALDALANKVSKHRYADLMAALEPLALFLKRQDEGHGIISNHLATSALGMVRWAQATQDSQALDRAQLWIDRIRAHASDEGWMMEYGGADPGYQSWCTSSLVQIAHIAPELELDPLLQRSFDFLETFAFPDGSYANGCGSRMTRFLMAAGPEMYKERSSSAARLAQFARQNCASGTYVTLDSIDEPNLVPFFNDTAVAAVQPPQEDTVPSVDWSRREFPKAGMIAIAGKSHRLVVNTKRGGWAAECVEGITTRVTREPVARTKDGVLLRPVRGKIIRRSEVELVIVADLEPVQRMLPSPLKFWVLRSLAMTVFRSLWLGNLVKRGLATLLLSERNTSKGSVRRTIRYAGGNCLDQIVAGEVTLIDNADGFSPMHMASQGYWQVGDDT